MVGPRRQGACRERDSDRGEREGERGARTFSSLSSGDRLEKAHRGREIDRGERGARTFSSLSSGDRPSKARISSIFFARSTENSSLHLHGRSQGVCEGTTRREKISGTHRRGGKRPEQTPVDPLQELPATDKTLPHHKDRSRTYRSSSLTRKLLPKDSSSSFSVPVDQLSVILRHRSAYMNEKCSFIYTAGKSTRGREGVRVR